LRRRKTGPRRRVMSLGQLVPEAACRALRAGAGPALRTGSAARSSAPRRGGPARRGRAP
jgi:hypothetical protein